MSYVDVLGGSGSAVSNTIVALTDGATPAVDASSGGTGNFTLFTLTSTTNPTIAVPTNPTGNGQKIEFRFTASGGTRTIAFNTGAGGFRYGTSIISTDITSTASGKTDRVLWEWNSTDSFWDILAYVKG